MTDVGEALNEELKDIREVLQLFSDSLSEAFLRLEDLEGGRKVPMGDNDEHCLYFETEELEQLLKDLDIRGGQPAVRAKVWDALLLRKATDASRPDEGLTFKQQKGRETDIKGRRAEIAVVDVLNNHSRRPEWMGEAFQSTPAEDRRGIDVVVETDVGDINVQVKSSYRNAQRFLEKWPQRNVGMVVVRPSDEWDTIFNKAIDAVGKQRSDILKAVGAA